MFIEDLYDFITFLKNQGQARYFTPEEVTDALNRAVLDVYYREYKLFEETGEISDALSPFKILTDINISTDKFLLPDKYRHITSHKAYDPDNSNKFYKINMITDGEWDEKTLSSLAPPTNSYPVMRRIKEGWEVKPDTIKKINISYIKNPDKAVYGYNIVNNRFVFDETKSTDVEFPEFVHNELIAQTLKYLGVVLNDALLIQFKQFQAA